MILIDMHGLAVWRNKHNKNLFLQRSYGWSDAIIIIDETKERTVVGIHRFCDFDFSGWIPVTKFQYQKTNRKLKEMYDHESSVRKRKAKKSSR